MSLPNRRGQECASDLVIPTCRSIQDCGLILQPGGCSSCAFQLCPHDEDGDPIPLDLVDFEHPLH